MRAIALPFIIFLTTLMVFGQEEVTVTIGYPDDEGYFVYSIPPTDEHARFGGIYYLKIENTGSVVIDNWKLATTWKTINSTWGVVEKTVINASQGKIELTQIVKKFSHDVAICFEIEKRGYLREGYFADIVIANLDKKQTVTKDSLLYKCGWSPFEGEEFGSTIETTIVSGNVVWNNGKLMEGTNGQRLSFDR